MKQLELRLEMEHKRALIWCGVSAFWAFSGFVGMGEEEGLDYILFCIIGFICVGIWGCYHGYKKWERVKKIRQYAPVIANEPTGDIVKIAARMGMTTEVVKSDLKEIIHRGYFKNAHFNNEANCVVINDQENGIIVGKALSEGEMQVVSCKCCTGVNKVVKGRATSCDYCGMPIQG